MLQLSRKSSSMDLSRELNNITVINDHYIKRTHVVADAVTAVFVVLSHAARPNWRRPVQ